MASAQGDPAWLWDNIIGVTPWKKQLDILESVWHNKKTIVKSCHGAGKSYTAARVGLAFLCAYPGSIVVTTAPTGRQVKKIIWQEWRKAVQKSKKPIGGDVLTTEHRMNDGWYAFGFATDIPDNFQGLHAERILVIVDEAAGISPEIWEAIEGLLTSEGSRLLAIGNPTDPSCEFANMFKEKGIKKMRISAFDTPNFTTYNITREDIANNTWREKITGPLPYPVLVTPEWVSGRYEKWGPESPMYISRVEGEFPEVGDNILIPLSWVEKAMARWHDMAEGTPRELGLDVARYGGDECALAYRGGQKVMKIETWMKNDLMETAGRTNRAIKDYNATMAKIDTIGLGAGVHDRLKEQKMPVMEVDVNKAPKDKEQFADLTSELWWNLRDMLNPDPAANNFPIGLPNDEELAHQLSSRRFSYTSRGQIKVEPKDEMKKRGLQSPDRADAVAIVFAPTPRRKTIGKAVVI